MAYAYRTPGIISNVRSRVQAVSTAAVTDPQVLKLLDEAQRDVCIQLNDAALWAIGEIATGALTLDANPYALPADFMRERMVKYKAIVARRWRVDELDALAGANPNLTPREDRPFYYVWDNVFYIEAGTKTAGSYYLHYLKLPPDLTVTTDPLLPVEYDDLLQNFAVARCLEARGELQEGEKLWQEYLGRCELVNSRYGGARAFDGVPNDRR